ncbi:hypothetical protein [Nocardia sp. NPDC050710]|uniref:hypothetical protein n=1 Tax=Nocardia sp. NPDC050710 TaxID=3157220 RepID=UPI0033D93792
MGSTPGYFVSNLPRHFGHPLGDLRYRVHDRVVVHDDLNDRCDNSTIAVRVALGVALMGSHEHGVPVEFVTAVAYEAYDAGGKG